MSTSTTDNTLQKLQEQLGDSIADITLIGTGGFGRVYKAHSTGLGKTVAIKVLNTDGAMNEVLRTRFMTEAKVLSKLTHENIVRLYRYGQLDDGSSYIIMEYVEGESIAARLAASGPMDLAQVKVLANDLCDAIATLHRNGVLHRDISPHNAIIFNNNGKESAKLIDFGLVKGLDGSLSEQRLTKTMEVCGSISYMSPEACLGKPIDERSDIYSLTCLIYEMLTGAPPYFAADATASMLAHVKARHVPVYSKLKQKFVYPQLEDLISKGLAKLPADRFSSVEQLAAALAAVSNRIPALMYNRAFNKVIAAGVSFLAVGIVIGALCYFGLQTNTKTRTPSGTSVALLKQCVVGKDPTAVPPSQRPAVEATLEAALAKTEEDQLLTFDQQQLALYQLESLYATEDNYQKCEAILDRSIALYHAHNMPFDERLHGFLRSYIGSARRTAHHLRGADKLSSIISQWPDSVNQVYREYTQLQLQEILLGAGQFSKALEIQRSLQKSPLEDALTRQEFILHRMTTALHLGDYKEAAALLSKIDLRSEIRNVCAITTLRAEIASGNWKNADDLASCTSFNTVFKPYGMLYSDPFLAGIAMLSEAHNKRWIGADQRFNALLKECIERPTLYFDVLMDFDGREYARLLKESGKDAEAQHVLSECNRVRERLDRLEQTNRNVDAKALTGAK